MKKIVAAFLMTVMCIFTVIPVLVHGQDKGKVSSGKNSSPKLKAKFRKGHPDKKIQDQYIVVFSDEVEDSEREAERIIVEHGGDRVQQKTYNHALKGFSVRMSEAEARKVSEDPRVEFVEEDQVVSLEATQTGATWGLDRIDQRDLPLNSTYTYNYTGAGVKAYIIDTGILASHTEFGGRVIAGYTAVSDGNGTTDCNGHGTHVSGTVGGATYGVAKGVTLVPVRVLDCSGSGTTSGVIAGVDWVTSDHTAGAPAVANMSLGGGISSALDTAVNNSINDGVTYSIAAGNDGLDACNYSPARVTNAITVGATTSTDSRASYSNYGTCVDIFAPGSSITSAWDTSTTATNTISGTSMATPHVTGVAALYLQTNPTASPATVWAAIRDSSTLNKVVSAGTGSPNRLLYSLLTTGGGGGGGGTTSQLFLNPGFESGNINWGADTGVITNSTSRTPRSGVWYAWLNGYGSANTDYLYQDVTIPANATAATLNFYLKIDTAETTTSVAYDTLTVTVRNTSGTVLQTLATYSNLNASGYTLRSFNLLAYKGQTIRVYFQGSEDSSLQTSFIIDDTALNVTQ